MMKRFFSVLAAFMFVFTLPAFSLAQGQQVTTATTFSGYDLSSQAYADALESWETASGNTVEDYSGIPDDAWQSSVDQMLSEGTLDLLYTSCALSDGVLSQFVPISELLAAYPDLPARSYASLAAADGNVYAMPVRFSFEALYINSDIFVENGIELPTSWDTLLSSIEKLKSVGITPIANSLSDWPACLVDCVVLSAGTSDEYMVTEGLSESYVAGMERIRTLYQNGAFGDQALTWTDVDAEAAFLNREAAMRVDGEWLCESIAEDQWNNTIVVAFPGTQENTCIAGTNAGFYITRAAFDDPQRREAVLSLLSSLLSEPASSSLFLSCGDALLESALSLINADTQLCPSLMDLVDFNAYDAWLGQVGSMASGEADITQTIKAAFES